MKVMEFQLDAIKEVEANLKQRLKDAGVDNTESDAEIQMLFGILTSFYYKLTNLRAWAISAQQVAGEQALIPAANVQAMIDD